MRRTLMYWILGGLAIFGYLFMLTKMDMIMERFDVLDDRLDAGWTISEIK